MNTPIEIRKGIEGLDGRKLEIVPCTQAHIENFEAIKSMLEPDHTTIFTRNGNMVRAAARAGILLGIEEDDINELPVGTVQWLATQVDTELADQVSFPVGE